MRILLLNQTFYPDVVATAQYLTSLAEALAERGHEVRVLAARRAYDEPGRRFAKHERYGRIEIERVGGTGFGKNAKWRRAVDFGSFLFQAALRLLTTARADCVVALTSPPLVAALAALRCRLRGERFVYWVMDLNPDEALAAGWLRPGPAAWALERISRFTLHSAEAVVVLDRYMRERVLTKCVDPERVRVVPPWSMDRYAHFDQEGRAAFRKRHGLTGKYVVMYSGNHSPVHPLDTLLQAALRLKSDPRFCFVFVGGGSEFGRLRAVSEDLGLTNVKFLPYQPIESLSASLSAADLQAVVLGSAMVGTIHPSKLYNVLAVGSRILYMGPERSHISETLEIIDAMGFWDAHAQREYISNHIRVDFGDVIGLTVWLEEDWVNWRESGRTNISPASRNYSEEFLLPQLVQIVEDRLEPVKFGVSSNVV
jgi:glycosyltransferase involved in cell wall biosynthesis